MSRRGETRWVAPSARSPRQKVVRTRSYQIDPVVLLERCPEVEDIKEIRGITIKGVQKKKKNVRVTYTVVS